MVRQRREQSEGRYQLLVRSVALKRCAVMEFNPVKRLQDRVRNASRTDSHQCVGLATEGHLMETDVSTRAS